MLLKISRRLFFLATEATLDEFTKAKVLQQCLNLGLKVRKINQEGRNV